MTLPRYPDFDENKAWDEMLADLNLTPSGMKTHKIQSSHPKESLCSMLQEPHVSIKTPLQAATPSFLPTLESSWRAIQKQLDMEADDYCYHFANELAQHSLLEEQKKLVLANAKRIKDDQKRFEEIQLMLQAPDDRDYDAFSSQFAEIEWVKLLIEQTPKTQGTWDAPIDLSFAEQKEKENEEIHEKVREIYNLLHGIRKFRWRRSCKLDCSVSLHR